MSAAHKITEGLKQAVAHAKGETVESFPDSSVISFRDGRLILIERGKIFPGGGGCEAGSYMKQTDLSSHIEDIVRKVIVDG